jgi:glucokinase
MRLLGRVEEATDHSCGPESVVAQVVRMMRASLDVAGLVPGRVQRLAVASPGPLDVRSGVVDTPPNMPGWGVVPLQRLLEESLGIRTRIANDATAAALGEFRFGSGRGTRNLVYLTISTGIGGGVVVDGRLLEGTSGAGGEIGHMTIDRHGPPCKCGSVGCLEALASGTNIALRFQRALERGGASCLAPTGDGAPPTARDIALAARHGDALALAVFRDAAEAIGTGVVNCIHIFNPEVVAIGGGVSNAGPLLFDTVREVVDRYALPMPRAVVRVVRTELGEEVGLMGAAAVAADDRQPATL